MDRRNNEVSASYSTVRSRIIRLTPESMQCRLYCRGSSCKYCTTSSWTLNQQAIHGVYSTWITDKVVAMARPTLDTFSTYKFVDQLRKLNIKSVVNMQTAGEHAFCGPPLLPSGFTYDPEELMKNDIFFYNFIWPDFGAAGVSTLLDIVKVVNFATAQGNVAVHCHAGIGRTGVVISAFLIWAHHLSVREAISHVRAKRPKSVQSVQQLEVVFAFSRFLTENARMIPPISTHTLGEYLELQNKIVSNEEGRLYRHVPKVAYVLCNSLLANIYENENRSACSSISIRTPYRFHCALGRNDWAAYLSKTRKVTPEVDLSVKMLSLLEEADDTEMNAELEQIAETGFNVIDLESFLRDHSERREIFLLYCLHRFMCSFVKPIATEWNILRLLREEREDPKHVVEAWQCFFYYLLNTLALACGSSRGVAARLIQHWYLGFDEVYLTELIEFYICNFLNEI